MYGYISKYVYIYVNTQPHVGVWRVSTMWLTAVKVPFSLICLKDFLRHIFISKQTNTHTYILTHSIE